MRYYPRITAMLFSILLFGCASQPKPQLAALGHPILLDHGWLFHKGDLPPGSSTQPVDDDQQWRSIELPHDWSVEGPYDPHLASCTAYLPAGIGWYRKRLYLPAALSTARISLRFDGVYENSTVWVNGHRLGFRPSGYATFEYDATPYLHFGGEANDLCVRVDHTSVADSRWYSGSGIYRPVYLVVSGRTYIESDSISVSTTSVTAAQATLRVASQVKNETGAAEGCALVAIIRDSDGREVARTSSSLQLGADQSASIEQTLSVPQAHLWSTTDPYLYRTEVQLVVGKDIVDRRFTTTGVRVIRFDPSHGFFLNGQPLKMKGVCLHENMGGLGAAIPASVWEDRLRELKDCGCNAIRTSHNPPAPQFLDVCDRLGLLVMDEALDEWTAGKKKWTNGHNKGQFSRDGSWSYFDSWGETDVATMVRRDRNHPCVVLWSIGNEIDYPNDPYPPNSALLPPIAAKLIQTIKALDQTRPVTAACASIGTNLFFPQLDVVGYNYQEKRYADDHLHYPQRIILGSENKATPDAWYAVSSNDFVVGQFLWTGMDFLGESPPWPHHASQAGLLDLAGFPKPGYFLRKALWEDGPIVYPFATGRGVSCFSNCASVQLILNGVSVGEQNVGRSCLVSWPVAFQSGSLEVVGKNGVGGGSREVCRALLRHPQPACQLRVVCSATTLLSGDSAPAQVADIEVDCVDANGTIDPGCAANCTIQLSGPVRLLGVENADPTCNESPLGDSHPVYHGRLRIYVAGERPGAASVKVACAGLGSQTLGLTVE